MYTSVIARTRSLSSIRLSSPFRAFAHSRVSLVSTAFKLDLHAACNALKKVTGITYRFSQGIQELHGLLTTIDDVSPQGEWVARNGERKRKEPEMERWRWGKEITTHVESFFLWKYHGSKDFNDNLIVASESFSLSVYHYSCSVLTEGVVGCQRIEGDHTEGITVRVGGWWAEQLDDGQRAGRVRSKESRSQEGGQRRWKKAPRGWEGSKSKRTPKVEMAGERMQRRDGRESEIARKWRGEGRRKERKKAPSGWESRSRWEDAEGNERGCTRRERGAIQEEAVRREGGKTADAYEEAARVREMAARQRKWARQEYSGMGEKMMGMRQGKQKHRGRWGEGEGKAGKRGG
ncbi:hypothetical protein EDB84DRAFT_1443865 [Lactarius hengduanensis]|nr:hypothetical protein EDB84DRAFT_1443865 [Lactarius hengduanensis]